VDFLPAQEVALMPLPRSIARFNRYVTNRVLGPLAPHLPAFGVVVHRGRKSGRCYRTPVNVFRRPGGFVVALTYGPNTDWVRNVLAAGGCVLETRGRRLRLTRPRLFHDESRRSVPAPLRPLGRLGGVSDFLDLSLADASPSSAPASGSGATAAVDHARDDRRGVG
jgi:deazaflavin-dependent oxidoreductase (nitroreductase family)